MSVITKEELIDASTDAHTLEDVVNGPANLNGNGTTPQRLGGSVYVLKKLEELYGEPATNAQLSQDWAEGTTPGGSGTKSSKEWSEETAELFNQGYTASTIPSATITGIKGLNGTTFPIAFCNTDGHEGFYKWNATFDKDRSKADLIEEHRIISPDTSLDGAWVRVNLSTQETVAINNSYRASLNKWPQPEDLLKPSFNRAPFFAKLVNKNSTSENLSDSHYGMDVTLEAETMEWEGVTLQRLTGASFSTGVRDIRAADYNLEGTGKLYIASAWVMAPRPALDSNNLREPNSFMWMQAVPNGTSYGHGAKLMFPTPRRVWCVIAAGLADRTTKTINDPTVPWIGQNESSTELRWFYGGAGIGDITPAPEIWLGGMQIEEALDQTEKVGFSTFGTSIDVMGNGSGDGKNSWAKSRAWPRWLEGLICAPVFDCSIGGQNSTQMEARFTTDVAPTREHAKYLILCANVNDFNSSFDSSLYRSNWASIYSQAVAAGWTESEIIWLTIQPRSSYDYANGSSDLEAENQYIKDTYRNVIDRGDIMRDAIDCQLLPSDWENDGIHQTVEAHRALGFMIYNKYRHLLHFTNTPGPYQKTIETQSPQSLGEPVALSLFEGFENSDSNVTAIRETDEGHYPVLNFTSTLTSNSTYQLPVPDYFHNGNRSDDSWQVQKVFNNTVGGFEIYIQYYKRDGIGGSLSTVGSPIGPIPNGECWSIMTNGIESVRVQ